MKQLLTTLVLTATAMYGATVQADTNSIYFASDLRNEFNTSPHIENIPAVLDPSWQPNGPDYFWVTCPGCDQTPALPLDGPPTVTFFEYIQVPDTTRTYTGSLHLWADDTARVYLDNRIIVEANPIQLDHCSAGPGCKPGMDVVTPISLSELGLHVLRIDDYQRVSYTPLGVMYWASLSAQPEVPEPGTMGLIGAGLVLLGWRWRRA